MSTGNNKDETLVTKKRKRVVKGYIHPNTPEIKRFDFFTGGYSDTGAAHVLNSREIVPIVLPSQAPNDGYGSWELIPMQNPSAGTTSYQRVGVKYFLKYIKFKGHISINLNLPFTIRYKLLLIKSDREFSNTSDFFTRCYYNYQLLDATQDTLYNREVYCRHNFYKTMKWFTGMSNDKTTVTVVSSGSLTPPDYIPHPTKTSTLGETPSWAYTVPDLLRFSNSYTNELQQVSYLPLNVSVQVNDNVEVGQTFFYLMLWTDHGVGVAYPAYVSSTQLFYRSNAIYGDAPAKFNFFGICYFTDL